MKQTIRLFLLTGATPAFAAFALGGAAVAWAQSPPAAPAPFAPSYPPAVPVAAPTAPATPKPTYVPVAPATHPAAPAPAAHPAAAAPAAAAPAAPAPAAPAPPPKGHTSPSAVAPGPAVTAPAPAPASSPFAAPTPPEELTSFFKGSEGVWRCDGKMPAGVAGPGSEEIPYKSMVRLKRDLGGFWIAGDYEIKKSKTTPGAEARFFIGYEPRSKQFVSASFDSLGGMDRGGSAGVQGNALALTGSGTVNGMKVQTRSTLTFTKPGKELAYKFELDRGQGFQLVGEDACKKLAGGPMPAASPGAAGTVAAPAKPAPAPAAPPVK